ncbi:MAG: hypothetical protein KDK70_32600, partial [Myxococcales bacterium]|nr:hypothetical protein [Myxococcales bacterium]
MACSMDRRWVIALLSLAVASGCTTGVTDNGFTATFTPVATSEPMGITTFEDTEAQGSTQDGPVTADGSSGDATATGATTTPDPDGTTGPDPGTTTDADPCVPACVGNETCVDGICEPPACNDVPGNYDGCLGPGGAVDVSGCDDPGATCITVG